jgi:hypothetical protein
MKCMRALQASVTCSAICLRSCCVSKLLRVRCALACLLCDQVCVCVRVMRLRVDLLLSLCVSLYTSLAPNDVRYNRMRC